VGGGGGVAVNVGAGGGVGDAAKAVCVYATSAVWAM